MITSKHVFDARRAGRLDEAYQIAVQLMAAPHPDEWEKRAFGWCLVDLIKRECLENKTSKLGEYVTELKKLKVAADDEVLLKQRDKALLLATPVGARLERAKQLSKEGRHAEAANLYREELNQNLHDQGIASSLGWELYRLAKYESEELVDNITPIKRILHEYLKLNVERPSRLHSCMLRIANRLVSNPSFSSIGFSQQWGLEYLLDDDWATFTTKNKRVIASNAERLIQHAAKDAIERKNSRQLEYILPFVDKAQERHPENVWLNLYRARILMCLERKKEAIDYAITLAKRKPNEYWVWELLGDLSGDGSTDLAMSCYCKALLCGAKEDFYGKVRLKLASLLTDIGLFEEAKFEVEKVVANKKCHGYRLPPEITSFQNSEWFSSTEAVDDNKRIYQKHAGAAERLLMSNLPWINGNFGDVWKSESRPGVQKFYIQQGDSVLELSEPAKKYSHLGLKKGAPIRLKGEMINDQHFQILKVEARDNGVLWDTMPQQVGVVNYVNHTKKLIHFIVDKQQTGVIRFSDLSDKFSVGDPIALRLATYRALSDTRLRCLDPQRTAKPVPPHLMKFFCEEVEVMSAGFGITASGIFVPPPIVKESALMNGQEIEGEAVINFDKKRSQWSWAALWVKVASDA